MSTLNTAPIMSNTTATPVVGAAAPVVPVATATTVLPHGVDGRHLSKEERKALKHQNKALKHDHAHHKHGHGGLTSTGLPLAAGAAHPLVHGATNVVEHQPIVEREVIVERPVEVRREHHIQPVIHERQHQIQPIVRTEVTTERRDLVTEHNVMLPAVIEQPHMATTTGVLHGTGAGAHHATIGQKIKGTVKEVQGTLTHNPMKKEEGRLLKQGIEPTTAGLGTTANTTHF